MGKPNTKSSGAKISVHFFLAKGLDKALKMKRLLI